MIEKHLRNIVNYAKQFYEISDKNTLSILIDVYALGFKDSLTGIVRDSVWEEIKLDKNVVKGELK